MLRIDLEGDLKAAMTRALLLRRSKLDLKTTYNGGHVRADRATEGNGKREGLDGERDEVRGRVKAKEGLVKSKGNLVCSIQFITPLHCCHRDIFYLKSLNFNCAKNDLHSISIACGLIIPIGS